MVELSPPGSRTGPEGEQGSRTGETPHTSGSGWRTDVKGVVVVTVGDRLEFAHLGCEDPGRDT